MKMQLAVYTAQEGYSWQPGTAFTADELMQFKKCMGKFPSPDSMDFPFGGIFRIGELVVLYRYHVAKKIDFRGRDALYCILGAVSRAEAAKIDPAVLFSLPEFAQPMKPFPTSAAVPETPSAPAWWLEKLNGEILNVRISGPADKPKYNFLTTPPGEDPKPRPVSAATSGMRGTSPSANVGAQKVTEVGQAPAPQVRTEIVRELYYPQWMIWTIATLAVMVLALSVLVAAMWWQMKAAAPTSASTGGTNAVEQAEASTNDATNVSTISNTPTATPAPEGTKTAPTSEQKGDKPQTPSGAAPAADQHKTEVKSDQKTAKDEKNTAQSDPKTDKAKDVSTTAPTTTKPSPSTSKTTPPKDAAKGGPKATSSKDAAKGGPKAAVSKDAAKGGAKVGDGNKGAKGAQNQPNTPPQKQNLKEKAKLVNPAVK